MPLENVEDIYPLSPMQEVMLFHACTQVSTKGTDSNQSTHSKDVLFNQTRLTIKGRFNNSCFNQAWQNVLDNHPALRSAFVYKGLKKPQQIVRSKLTVPYLYADLSAQTANEQKTAIEKLCFDDRTLGFKLELAPLFRVAVVKHDDNLHQLIWSSHHLVIDRWCIPLIFDELLDTYDALTKGEAVSNNKRPAYKRYIAWLKQQDPVKAQSFWLKQLYGFNQSSSLTRRQTAQQTRGSNQGQAKNEVTEQSFIALKDFCHNHKLTMATLAQGAWALLLHQYTQRQSLMFGVVVSGRPANLDGVEDIIGSFVNNLPIRVSLSQGLKLVDWLQDIQRTGYTRTAYEHIPTPTLQSWSELPAEQSLFDSILVWLAPSKIKKLSELSVEPLSADMNTAYPLTLSFEETPEALKISAKLADGFCAIDDLSAIIEHFSQLIMAISQSTADELLTDLDVVKIEARLAKAPATTEFKTPNLLARTAPVKSGNLPLGREQTDLAWIEEFLRSEWLNILGLEQVDLDDDFFALGGSSIKAAQLLSRVEQAERKSIPILSLFQQPSIREMAKLIAHQNWPLVANLVTCVNGKGSQTPLFCIASPDVNTLGYANLSNNLSPDIPLYVVQSPPDKADVRQIKAKEIPDFATRYIEAIKKIQPSGPYRLLGMCTGAQIAIEMGRQLEAQSQSFDFLGVINTWAFYTISPRFKYRIIENRYRYRINYYREKFKTLTVKEVKRLLQKKLLRFKHKINFGSAASIETTNNPQTKPNLPYSIIDDVGWEHLQPELQKVVGKVSVFRCKKQPYWRVPMRCLGWTKHAEEVDIVDIKGKEHLTILRQPYVAGFAKHLEKRLSELSHQNETQVSTQVQTAHI